MTDAPDRATLYPDITAAGSLSAALQTIADGKGISVPFEASEHDPLGTAAVAATVAHRKVLSIDAWTRERKWSINGSESFQGLTLVQGRTPDLTQIVQAAHAWHTGAPLADIRRAADFVHLSGRFEVPTGDPVQLAQSEWQHLRTEAEEKWPEYRMLIEAAWAEPALRGLYPFTSHWTLRFSTRTRPHLNVLPICLTAHGTNRYTLTAHYLGDVLHESSTAAQAVAAAVVRLPSGLAPVALGNHRVPEAGGQDGQFAL